MAQEDMQKRIKELETAVVGLREHLKSAQEEAKAARSGRERERNEHRAALESLAGARRQDIRRLRAEAAAFEEITEYALAAIREVGRNHAFTAERAWQVAPAIREYGAAHAHVTGMARLHQRIKEELEKIAEETMRRWREAALQEPPEPRDPEDRAASQGGGGIPHPWCSGCGQPIDDPAWTIGALCEDCARKKKANEAGD